jgi:hypothetical protein
MKFRDINPLNIRFPADLKKKLKAAADAKTGSMNAEVIDRVAASFERRTALKDFTDGELVDELIKRWGRDGLFIRLGKEE